MNLAWTIENYLEIKNTQLHIDGVSAIDLTNEFGTPLFVFSEKRIKHNVERLRRAEKAIDCPLKICYAAKANSNMAILRSVKDAGGDLEVNSGGELFKALKVGFRPEQIIFNGTSKTETELEEAISAGIYAIQSDSVYELELTEKVAQRLNKRANVSLRFVPNIETATLHGLQTAKQTSKFGMTWEEIIPAFRRWGDSERLNLCGIHLHLGSQTPDVAPFTAAISMLFATLRQIFDETGCRLSHINLGGGFPVNYLRDEANTRLIAEEQRELFAADLEPFEVFRAITETVRRTIKSPEDQKLWDDLTVLIEPGRSVIADAGICLTSVRNYKERLIQDSGFKIQDSELNVLHSQTKTGQLPAAKDVWLLTDAGFNVLLSMETYKWYYHLISASRADAAHETPYKVAGPLCDGGDVYFDIEGQNRLPDYRLLPANVQPNEVLALLNCGAYSIAQMSQYNGRQLPAIVLIKENGTVELARKRDSYDNLLTNDVW